MTTFSDFYRMVQDGEIPAREAWIFEWDSRWGAMPALSDPLQDLLIDGDATSAVAPDSARAAIEAELGCTPERVYVVRLEHIPADTDPDEMNDGGWIDQFSGEHYIMKVRAGR